MNWLNYSYNYCIDLFKLSTNVLAATSLACVSFYFLITAFFSACLAFKLFLFVAIFPTIWFSYFLTIACCLVFYPIFPFVTLIRLVILTTSASHFCLFCSSCFLLYSAFFCYCTAFVWSDFACFSLFYSASFLFSAYLFWFYAVVASFLVSVIIFVTSPITLTNPVILFLHPAIVLTKVTIFFPYYAMFLTQLVIKFPNFAMAPVCFAILALFAVIFLSVKLA